jgi:glyoxylase-like metal-dependent hydrolase (beta-lactamase superfamily II)
MSDDSDAGTADRRPLTDDCRPPTEERERGTDERGEGNEQRVPRLECHVLDTGYCLVSEHLMIRGGRHEQVACHGLVALLRHPEHGWLLWDTGYAPRMWEATRGWPFWLYRLATPLHITPELAVVAQLGRWGLQAGDIGRIIISHFHADHVAGLLDFPDAQLIASEAGYTDVAARRGVRALGRAFVPGLMPGDFARRALLIPEPFTEPSLPGLGPTHDLFGDGSLRLVALPGHARGQIGLLAETERGRILFAADGAWLSRAIREGRPPHWLTHFFVDDPAALAATIRGLQVFARACPEVNIIPTHCPEAFEREVEPWTPASR